MSTIHRQRTYIIDNWGILCGTFGVNHIWKKIGENKGGGGRGGELWMAPWEKRLIWGETFLEGGFQPWRTPFIVMGSKESP